jgi:hypothetical protein
VRLSWSVRSVAIFACTIAASGRALAESGPNLCAVPKMNTEKWPSTEQVGGVTILLPPGFHSTGNSSGLADEKYFVSGRHREIAIGSGSAPRSARATRSSIERLPASALSPGMSPDFGSSVTPLSACETTISGRRVNISLFSVTTQDRGASDPSNAGTVYRVVARFYAAPPLGEMFISFQTDSRSEISDYRQIFWTATFDGSAPPSSVSAKPTASGAVAAAPAPPPCIAKPDPSLPAPDAVLDTALVQSLVSSTGPVPHGFALMSLKFDGKGALTSISVPESDLPDPAQKQLATLIASNLKPHDKQTPSSYRLRVDAADTGLHYAVQPACAP